MQKEITFGEVADQWKQSKREVVKHTTLCAYMLILKTHLLPRFGNATSIGETDVQQFIFDKLRSGLSRSTVHDMVAVLKAVMKYGARHRLIHSADWELVYPTDTPVRRLPVLSLADHRKLLNAITAAPSGRNIGVLLALCAGLRIGEVCALRWKDIDLSRRIITVGGTLCRVYNCDKRASEILMSTPKTRNSHREIPIPSVLYDALCRVKRSQRQPVYVVGSGETAKEPRTYRETFRQMLRRLGIPDIVFHGLRHTFATRCIESGCDYKTVSALLGHSNVATTLNLYVHPGMEQKKRCMDRLSRFIRTSPRQ